MLVLGRPYPGFGAGEYPWETSEHQISWFTDCHQSETTNLMNILGNHCGRCIPVEPLVDLYIWRSTPQTKAELPIKTRVIGVLGRNDWNILSETLVLSRVAACFAILLLLPDAEVPCVFYQHTRCRHHRGVFFSFFWGGGEMDVFWNKKWRIKDTAKNLIRFWSPKLVGLQISCPFPFGHLFGFQRPISFRRW